MPNLSHLKRASEIFGQKSEIINKEEIISSDYKCPFIGRKCNKQSRLISYPMGVCSVYVQNDNVVICPQRFNENNKVFTDIANDFFGSAENTILFSEIKVTGIGSFDFVIVKHEPMSTNVEDFVVVEIQSDSTTGTGKLVRNFEDVFSNNQVRDRYNFGMNTYNTIKLSFIQMLMKGQAMEHWNKNIVWVMQDFIFSNMMRRFALDKSSFTKSKFNHFFIYDLKETDETFSFNLENKYSATVEELSRAFQRHQGLPRLDAFIRKLQEKIQLQLKLDIR